MGCRKKAPKRSFRELYQYIHIGGIRVLIDEKESRKLGQNSLSRRCDTNSNRSNGVVNICNLTVESLAVLTDSPNLYKTAVFCLVFSNPPMFCDAQLERLKLADIVSHTGKAAERQQLRDTTTGFLDTLLDQKLVRPFF